jgi:hypothetical protein
MLIFKEAKKIEARILHKIDRISYQEKVEFLLKALVQAELQSRYFGFGRFLFNGVLGKFLLQIKVKIQKFLGKRAGTNPLVDHEMV